MRDLIFRPHITFSSLVLNFYLTPPPALFVNDFQIFLCFAQMRCKISEKQAKAAARLGQQLFRKRKRGKQNSEHILVVIPARAQELHPLGDVHGVVADALEVLDDHQHIQRGVHFAGVGGDLRRQHPLDGVEVVVHRVVGVDDSFCRRLIFCRKGAHGVLQHLVGFAAHLNAPAHGGVARLADAGQMGDDLRDEIGRASCRERV